MSKQNIEFKDSGIPWIGQIPKHWEISKIKYHGTASNGLTYSPSDLTDESGTLVLRASNIQNDKLSFNDTPSKIKSFALNVSTLLPSFFANLLSISFLE